MLQNGEQYADTSMSDLDKSDTDTSSQALRKPKKGAHAQRNMNGSNPGPWTHSTNSYSRKVDQTHSNSSQKTANRTYCLFITLSVGTFVIGVALGIVIGTFAVKGSSENNNSAQSFAFKNSSSSSKAAITPALPYSSTEADPCQCPTTTTETTIKTTTASCPACVCSCPTAKPTMTSAPEHCRKCGKRNPDISTGSETSASPFAPLTLDEMTLALKALEMRGLVSANGNDISQNRAAHMYLMPMEKAQVLRYLDENGLFPGRYAEVRVFRATSSPPDVMEYRVGPLHKTLVNIQVEKLRNDAEIDFNRRPFDFAEVGGLYEVITPHLSAIRKLLQESFDGAYYANGTLPSFATLPSMDTNDRLSAGFLYLRMGGFPTIRMIPLTFIVHHPGTNTSRWHASDFYYASQGPFSSGMEMQEAYNNGTLRKFTLPKGYRQAHYNELNLQLNSSLPPRELSDLPPPRTYEPEGPRYTIKGHRVRWMDWNFEFTSNPVHGPAIYDIRFKNQRIAYEISLQDITLLYSSQSNGAGPPALSDTVYLLGNYNSPRYGLDCPDRGKILYASKFLYRMPDSIIPAACVFEADGQRPYWRLGSRGLADHHLIIRASMNLGNYDYTLEWKFFLDGSLETLLSASGYLYGAVWDPNDINLSGDKFATPFGYRISDYLLGPIHDHNYLFKVDLDILGTNNSFQTLHWRAGSTTEAFQTRVNITTKPSFFYFNNTRYIESEILTRENSFISNPLKPKYWTVVNENERNSWGNKRGYRVIPYSSSAEILQDHVMLNAWDHMKFMLAVTKYKHSELYGSTSWYDLQLPIQPYKGVGRMLDNETVIDEDLVLWISEKFFHAPSSEDLPMTLSVPNGFMLKPYNYFDKTPVFDVPSHYSFQDPYNTEPCYVDL